jgi:Tfp pilus assembly protein PilN
MIRALRPLALDYKRVRAAAPWAGWVLLALAILFLADVGYSYYAARQSLAETEARLAKLVRSGAAGRSAARPRAVSPEEITVARETYQRLATPWDELFGALESAANERITLIAIEPDAKAGTVALSGEAKDYPAALDYVARLRASRLFSNAHLVKHEARGNQEVAFSVAAKWGEVKR